MSSAFTIQILQTSLCVCVSVCIPHMSKCPWRWEGSVRFPRTGITGVYGPFDMSSRNETNLNLPRVLSALSHWVTSSPYSVTFIHRSCDLIQSCLSEYKNCQVMVGQIFNPGTQETVSGTSLSSRPAWTTERVPGLSSVLYIDLSQKTYNNFNY